MYSVVMQYETIKLNLSSSVVIWLSGSLYNSMYNLKKPAIWSSWWPLLLSSDDENGGLLDPNQSNQIPTVTTTTTTIYIL
ncbi:hypothetical protein DERP_007631 [Dermatophagoides pteronyssinus]|uniref:Uncharacterized protein n=1 Tax=Dermatophagoides pteronyssinus TaxID=6956 RepID=A0ABQ8JKA5_DERPT|nr:hypothetical protein DERP_007631 [Dermatophagoides pteronyssinus]